MSADTGSTEIHQGTDDVQGKRKNNVSAIEKIRKFLLDEFPKYSSKITMDTMRPLPTFLGITGPSFCLAPDAFTPPTKKMDKNSAEKISQRIYLNFTYFLTNYAFIAAGTCIIIILLHPRTIIYSIIVCALWKMHDMTEQQNTPLILMNRDVGQYITVELRTRLLYAITLYVVVLHCLKPVITAVGLTGLMIFSHALLRDPKQIEHGSSYMDDESSDDDCDSSGSEVMVETTV
mmetsp:Transcript_20877/g.30577  ORF Transcript_20877/g.30577 Transcript_20877/m.30577 type:complete len:233 (-) Transcript_20877:73-771(-)|eukprot:CAMPEP_0197244710 /NCGR_PEP_ID=MMETSP1429-20130617/9744_1 /TAXON_ID=49237 /ORGANISM="Chaetoceros  sp., Strain UNC1202" /LENGTH=232 /DNA_ID=CAMNT_0042705107 /DNA_START=209 /DNA_END=907 /DNA_ORIENTATION=-